MIDKKGIDNYERMTSTNASTGLPFDFVQTLYLVDIVKEKKSGSIECLISSLTKVG